MKYPAVCVPSLLVLLLVLSPCCRSEDPAPPTPTPSTTTTSTAATAPSSSPTTLSPTTATLAQTDTMQISTDQSLDGNSSTLAPPSSSENDTDALSHTTEESGSTTPSVSTMTPTSSTQEVTSAALSTQPNTNTITTSPDNTTAAPATTSTAAPNTSTAASATTPTSAPTITPTSAPTTTSTAAPSSTAASSTLAVSTTTAHPGADVVISETNLLLTTGGSFFVELQGVANGSLNGLSLVILDGTSAKQKVKKDFLEEDVLSPEGILTSQNDSQDVASLTLVVVALYRTDKYNSSSPQDGSLDRMVITSDPAAQLSSGLKETMLPDGQHPVVISAGLSSTQNLSLSRCSSSSSSSSNSGAKSVMMVVSNQTKGVANMCTMSPVNGAYTLQLHQQDKNCEESSETSATYTQKVQDLLAWAMSSGCQCGITPTQIIGNLSCARDLYFDFSLQESYTGQGDRAVEAFMNYSRAGGSMEVGGVTYTVVNCTSKCRGSGPHHQPQKDGSTTVTVAVVLSCVALFLIILVSVVLYMRGKRRGIIRQFRMTRLQEDDDMDDMDDFIGGGASFTRS